jgi:peptide methionine sulfoxide reductase MsrB
MSKRHYVRTFDGGYKCVACREEFETREDFASHCGFGGKCKHPMTIGMLPKLEVSVYRWHKAA